MREIGRAVAQAAAGGAARGHYVRGDPIGRRQASQGAVKVMRASMGLLLAFAASAAVVPTLTVDELVDRSEIIVHGRIARSWAAWDGAHKYIWTHHEVEIIDPIAGAGYAPVVVSEPGGKLDGIEMRFSGTVSYAVGEEAVVFLYRTPIGYYRSRYVARTNLRLPELKARVR